MKIYNNDFFLATAIYTVICHRETWKVSEIALILPIVTHTNLVNTIKRKKSYISFLDIVIDKPELFYNFNQMYHAYKVNLINALTLLESINVLEINQEIKELQISNEFKLQRKMNTIVNNDNRLIKIDEIAEKLADMVKDKVSLEELYVQLGVSL